MRNFDPSMYDPPEPPEATYSWLNPTTQAAPKPYSAAQLLQQQVMAAPPESPLNLMAATRPTTGGGVPSAAAAAGGGRNWKNLLMESAMWAPFVGSPIVRGGKKVLGKLGWKGAAGRAAASGTEALAGQAALETAAGTAARGGLGRFALTKLGPIGLGFGAGLAAEKAIPDEGAGSWLGEAAIGAGIGAGVGTVVPGVGNVVGGLIGGGIGAAGALGLNAAGINPMSWFGGEEEEKKGTSRKDIIEGLAAFGATSQETNTVLQNYDALKDNVGKFGITETRPEEYLGEALAAIQQPSMDEQITSLLGPEQRMSPADTLMLQNWSGQVMKPYVDDTIKNIDAAAEQARQSGLGGIADQYFGMSKNVANAYALQALTFPSYYQHQQQVNRLIEQQTMRNNLAQQYINAAGGGGTTGGDIFSGSQADSAAGNFGT